MQIDLHFVNAAPMELDGICTDTDSDDVRHGISAFPPRGGCDCSKPADAEERIEATRSLRSR